MPEVQSAGSCDGVAPMPAVPSRECNTRRKVSLVQHSPLFVDIPPADCREIVPAARESRFARRDTIFLDGDPIRQVVLLNSGTAAVLQGCGYGLHRAEAAGRR